MQGQVRAWVAHPAPGGFVELDAPVVAPALPAACGLVAAAVAAAPLVAESGEWPALEWALPLAVRGSQVETDESREQCPALAQRVPSPELPDSQAGLPESQGDWRASIWPASSCDSGARLVWFLLLDDLAKSGLVCRPREALLVVLRRVESPEDLTGYTAADHIPAGCQE